MDRTPELEEDIALFRLSLADRLTHISSASLAPLRPQVSSTRRCATAAQPQTIRARTRLLEYHDNADRENQRECIMLTDYGWPSLARRRANSTLTPMDPPTSLARGSRLKNFINARQTLLQQHVEVQGGAAPEIQCMRLQKDLRGSSPLIVQQRKEFPFRVELGRGAELGQQLARDAVDAHAGPLRALVAILSAMEDADAALVMATADATGRTKREKIIKANPFLEGLTVADLRNWADRKMRVPRL